MEDNRHAARERLNQREERDLVSIVDRYGGQQRDSIMQQKQDKLFGRSVGFTDFDKVPRYFLHVYSLISSNRVRCACHKQS